MSTLTVTLALAIGLFTLATFLAFVELAPRLRPVQPRLVVQRGAPQVQPRVAADIVTLREQLRTRTLREPVVVWPATDFADTEFGDPTTSEAAAAATAPFAWAPVERRDDLRLSLDF